MYSSMYGALWSDVLFQMHPGINATLQSHYPYYLFLLTEMKTSTHIEIGDYKLIYLKSFMRFEGRKDKSLPKPILLGKCKLYFSTDPSLILFYFLRKPQICLPLANRSSATPTRLCWAEGSEGPRVLYGVRRNGHLTQSSCYLLPWLKGTFECLKCQWSQRLTFQISADWQEEQMSWRKRYLPLTLGSHPGLNHSKQPWASRILFVV